MVVQVIIELLLLSTQLMFKVKKSNTFDGTSLTLTGQLTSSGDISGSSTSTGSFGVIDVGGATFTSASLDWWWW